MRSGVYLGKFLRIFLLGMLAALLMTSISMLAQERFSSITGTVTDTSKGVLQGVTVTATNKESNRVIKVTTGQDGRYSVREVDPGRYSLVFEQKGFRKLEVADVNLLLGKNITYDAMMQVGGLEQVVTVADAPSIIDLASTTVAHNVTSEEFDRMPKTRTFQSVALTSPSVTSGDIEGGIQVNGASGAENVYTVDGISTSSVIDGSSRQNASFEYLQEVQVKTMGLEAEYGGAMGGVISAVTKSGGNQFHGEFHWFNGGSPYNASPNLRLEVDNNDDRKSLYIQDKKFADHTNEIGGSIGGPIIKDRLFFFTSFSPQLRRRSSSIDFSDGPSTFKSSNNYLNLFNKISLDATKRIRANFSWLYQSDKTKGYLPAFGGLTPNSSTRPASAYDTFRTQGDYTPENNYAGTVDITLSKSSLLSLRGGYFWYNYKDQGAPSAHQVRYRVDARSLPFTIPVVLQQPNDWINVPATTVNFFDVSTRGYFQADFSQSFRALGFHTLKIGAGLQKSVSDTLQGYNGGFIEQIYWDRDYKTAGNRGDWGYYRLIQYGAGGSAGAFLNNMYIQDQWRIHPRLTLNLGLRTEHENIPTMRVDIQKYAFQFGWGDKLAPRLGASLDVLGDGKWKIFGSWGRFYDWTKYDMVRGSFGGNVWREWFHALDAGTDIFAINLSNTPGRNLLASGDPFIDYRIPSFGSDAIDPSTKPMFQTTIVIGSEYMLGTGTTFGVNWVHSRVNRTIEDMGYVRGDSFGYALGNPGEGAFKMETNHISATPDFPMPLPRRDYDALQLTFSRRFSKGWYLGANYTYSRLYGIYPGLSDTDEIAVGGWSANQGVNQIARPGTNTSTQYDSEAYILDSKGRYLYGRLATDRPHAFKAYGSYDFKWGTTVSANFFVESGTPLTTQLEDSWWDPMMINGRGDMGRTPVLSQTDLAISHEFKFRETKRLHLEFNMMNIFNQKTVRHTDTLINRSREASTEMVLDNVNLLQGFDWQSLFSQTAWAVDPALSTDPHSLDPLKNYSVSPTYHKADLWNTGFRGRIGVKFIF
jgi:hypothetical protein